MNPAHHNCGTLSAHSTEETLTTTPRRGLAAVCVVDGREYRLSVEDLLLRTVQPVSERQMWMLQEMFVMFANQLSVELNAMLPSGPGKRTVVEPWRQLFHFDGRQYTKEEWDALGEYEDYYEDDDENP